ncbi:hypothetical protein MQM1_030 [Aeromonas phage vB_AsaP_MQM1]|nr:hypothetical protein MQM1_030 [Aeromonas phage vB_AsaP_MQM1]
MKVVSITNIYQGFCKVQKVTLENPEGQQFEAERVIRKPAVLAICHDPINDKVMLVQQYRVGAMRTLIEWPGGLVNEDELEHQAVAREVLEETGVEVKSVTHLFSYLASPGLQMEPVQIFYCTFDSREVEERLMQGEGMELTQVVLKGAKELIREVERGEHCSLPVITGAMHLKMMHHRIGRVV